MKSSLTAVAVALMLALGTITAGDCTALVPLLTPEEAALPNAKSYGFAGSERNDGPAIIANDVQADPKDGSFLLKVRFVPREGSAVDLSTLKVECLKSTPIDLTPRVKPYLDDSGLNMQNLFLPAGTYRFRVAIGDLNGRFSQKEFSVKVSMTY